MYARSSGNTWRAGAAAAAGCSDCSSRAIVEPSPALLRLYVNTDCLDDAAEPDDGEAEARPRPVGSWPGLYHCAFDEDWSRFHLAEAAAIAIELNFDVALVDLRIPGSGGLSLLRAIRKVSPQTETIVITGYPSLMNAKESIRLGAFAFVAKPVVPQTLRTVVSQVLTCKPWKIQERCFNGT